MKLNATKIVFLLSSATLFAEGIRGSLFEDGEFDKEFEGIEYVSDKQRELMEALLNTRHPQDSATLKGGERGFEMLLRPKSRILTPLPSQKLDKDDFFVENFFADLDGAVLHTDSESLGSSFNSEDTTASLKYPEVDTTEHRAESTNSDDSYETTISTRSVAESPRRPKFSFFKRPMSFPFRRLSSKPPDTTNAIDIVPQDPINEEEATKIRIASALYGDSGLVFESINDFENLLIGKLLSNFGTDDRHSIYEAMLRDLNTPEFIQFIRNIRKQAMTSLNEEEMDGEVDLQVGSHYFSLESIVNSVQSFVSGLLGRGSTIVTSHAFKIGEYYDLTIFTPRDYVYYPGLSKLVTFFIVNFNKEIADALMYQFVRTAYSGVYGPRLDQLPFITRIEDIPDNFFIDHPQYTRQSFMNPETVAEIRQLDGIVYKPLNPIPKTLDDLLHDTELILNTYRPIPGVSFKEKVRDPDNISHLQSFFLDLTTVQDCLEMLEMVPSGQYRNHYAAFLYAAFLRYKHFTRNDFVFSLPSIKAIMLDMMNLNIDVDAFYKERPEVAEITEAQNQENEEAVFKSGPGNTLSDQRSYRFLTKFRNRKNSA